MNKAKKQRVLGLACLFALLVAMVLYATLLREFDAGSEVAIPVLAEPVILEEGMFFGDMGSVGLKLVGSNSQELTVFYSQPHYSSDVIEKNRLYIGIPPHAKLVAKRSNTESTVLNLIEAGLAEKVNVDVVWSVENTRENADFAAKKIQNAIRYGHKITN